MNPVSGTYVLILMSRGASAVQIGRWGVLAVEPGYYLYVGSAFGPGGVRSRVLRHCQEAKKKHWHIDYLRDLVEPIGAWYSHSPERIEHQWAEIFSSSSSLKDIQNFGSSDCRCDSHLFHTTRKPTHAKIISLLGQDIEFWSYRKTCKKGSRLTE